jgi:hypothetical protein
MIRVFCRCNGGDYFIGEYCPFDGWSSPESEAIASAVRRLEEEGIMPSVDTLREAGLGPEALARTVVIEFGSDASAFEAVTPSLLVVSGQACELTRLGPEFK